VNFSSEFFKGFDMKNVFNAMVLACAVFGIATACHMIGSFGHRQGVDEFLVAGTVFPLGIFGVVSCISTFFEL